jgi:hypothetical protein
MLYNSSLSGGVLKLVLQLEAVDASSELHVLVVALREFGFAILRLFIIKPCEN